MQWTKEKNKRTNNDLQNITQKTIDQETRTPLKDDGELGFYRRFSSSCFMCDTCRVTVKLHEHRLVWKSCLIPVYVNKYKRHYENMTSDKTTRGKDEPH